MDTSVPKTNSPEPNELDHIWSNVLEDLRTRLCEEVLETWFRRTALVDLTPDTVTVGVPNPFCESWLTRHYLRDLVDSFEATSNFRPRCVFQVDPEIPSFPFLTDTGDPSNTPPPAPVASAAPSVFPMPAYPPPGFRNGPDVHLNRGYTFDNFVRGRCNEFAQAAAHGILEAPGRTYNPFFLYGSVGLGKTHLLQATCHALLNRQVGCRILYLSSETFINHFIAALEEGNINAFRHRYRGVDVLVIDDVHLLSNKERTQDEFFHTFNVLYSAGKQIILSSDSPPAELKSFQDRLVSRFKWGLVASIEPPDYETRFAIVKRKAKLQGVDLPQDVAHFIAEGIHRNVRELEGAVTKIVGVSRLSGRELTLELAREAIEDFLTPEAPSGLPASEIIGAVCERFGVRLQDLQSKKRTQTIVLPRQVAMTLCRKLTPLSLEEIGSYFGGRDHSTVLYGLDKVEERMGKDPAFRKTVDDLMTALRRKHP